MNDYLKFLLDQLFISMSNKQIESRKKCDGCEISLGYLLQSGRLGCSQCYESFKEVLKDMVLQMNFKHIGKRPKMNHIIELEQKMVSLALEGLEEEAMKIRDEIRGLRGI